MRIDAKTAEEGVDVGEDDAVEERDGSCRSGHIDFRLLSCFCSCRNDCPGQVELSIAGVAASCFWTVILYLRCCGDFQIDVDTLGLDPRIVEETHPQISSLGAP